MYIFNTKCLLIQIISGVHTRFYNKKVFKKFSYWGPGNEVANLQGESVPQIQNKFLVGSKEDFFEASFCVSKVFHLAGLHKQYLQTNFLLAFADMDTVSFLEVEPISS